MAARRKNNQSPPFLTPFELGGVRADLSVTRSRTHSAHDYNTTPSRHWFGFTPLWHSPTHRSFT